MGPVYDLLLSLKSRVRVRYHRCVLIDPPSILNYPFHLNVISRLVIVRELIDLLAKLPRHYGSAITHICHIANVVNDKYYDGA